MYQIESEVSQIFEAEDESQLRPIADFISRSLLTSNIVLLRGDMGTGKTTLVKTLLASKGFFEVSSPTFSIVNRYDTSEGPFYHFDLYRVETIEELFDIGLEEYLDSGHPCLIEWPQLIENSLSSPFVNVDIQLLDDLRVFKISLPEIQE